MDTGTNGMAHVLIVEDGMAAAELIRRNLVKRGHSAVVAISGAEACKAVMHQEFDLVILDWRLPDGLADTAYGCLISACPKLQGKITIFSASDPDTTAQLFLVKTGVDWIVKPFSAGEAERLVELLLAGIPLLEPQ